MTRRLFLDDERMPPGSCLEWAIVRTYEDAVAWVLANGFPDMVSFDNDLGAGQREGWEFARWLVEHDLDTGTMPPDFHYVVHSQNPAGRANIEARMQGYLAHKAGMTGLIA